MNDQHGQHPHRHDPVPQPYPQPGSVPTSDHPARASVYPTPFQPQGPYPAPPAGPATPPSLPR
jgi:hypothetical protein